MPKQTGVIKIGWREKEKGLKSISSGAFQGDRSGLQPCVICGRRHLGLTAQAGMCQAVGPEKRIF